MVELFCFSIIVNNGRKIATLTLHVGLSVVAKTCKLRVLRPLFQAYRKWIATTNKGKEEPKLPGLPYTANQLYFVNAAQVIHIFSV